MTKRRRKPSQAGLLFTPRIDLCVDFANTLAPRGGAPVESLHNLRDVLDWCSSNAGITAKAGATATVGATKAGAIAKVTATAKVTMFADSRAAIDQWIRAPPGADRSLYGETIALRESLYRILHALACADDPPLDDLEAFNRDLAASPQRQWIERTTNGFGWRVETASPTVATILAPVLWSAGALLTGPQLAQIRECANAECLWLFVDDSRNGTRRWCSMQACGNRAKARRHYLRHAD
jgi:predicted RNA-binding Zn ribbon-like protein